MSISTGFATKSYAQARIAPTGGSRLPNTVITMTGTSRLFDTIRSQSPRDYTTVGAALQLYHHASVTLCGKAPSLF